MYILCFWMGFGVKRFLSIIFFLHGKLQSSTTPEVCLYVWHRSQKALYRINVTVFSLAMLKTRCMHCSFESSAETFEELDKIYASHSKTADHLPDYHFYDDNVGKKRRPS